MKKTGSFYSVFAVTILLVACVSKKEDAENHELGHGHQEAGVWKEMDEFHTVMAEAFHPYKDSSNLEPAKRRASELMTAANAWSSSDLPARVNNDDVRTKLQQLKSEAATLAETVRSSDDNVISEQLTKLHDTFHEIQEAWYDGH